MGPSYKTNDPRGWGGDPARGAALGRSSFHLGADWEGKLYLRRVPLDSGGYDPNGTYFGAGTPLYWAASEDCSVDFVLRAASRGDAKKAVLTRYPKARFFR